MVNIPFIMAISGYYLCSIFGWSLLAGVGIGLISAFINYIVGKVLSSNHKVIMDKQDKRLNFTKEALNNIKNLKFYSWTEMFEKEIFERRENELTAIQKSQKWVVILIGNICFFPNILPPIVLAVFIATGHSINLSTTITCMLLFGMIQGPLRQAPNIYTDWVQLRVSMDRVQKFLSADEVDLQKLINRVDITKKDTNDAITIDDSCFTWGINKRQEEDQDK